MATIQHYIHGSSDDSLTLLAKMYGVGWKDIGVATFGSWGASVIYPWLQKNGGIRGASGNVPTGYNWFFAPGMVVNIPGARESLSPVLSNMIPPAKPGGPLVKIVGAVTPPPEPAQSAPDPVAYANKEEQTIVQADIQAGTGSSYTKVPTTPTSSAPPTATGKKPTVAKAGMGSMVWILVAGVLVLVLLKKKSKTVTA